MFSVSMPRLVSLCVAISGLFSFSASVAVAQQVQYSSAHRNAERALSQTLSGGSKAVRTKLASTRSGISLAVADFDRDGTQDLVTGYATSGGGALTLQLGSAAATSPSASDWAAMQRGELVSPFVQTATVTELPVQPDFLKAVDIDGNGLIDVVVAARNGNSAYVLLGDGKGGFAAPQALPVQGAISALTTWRGPEGTNFIVAGVCGNGGGCSLQVLAADGTVHASIPLSSAASDLQTASLNGGAYPDLVVVAGGSALLIDGDSVLSGAPHTETLPVSGAVTVAAGSFFYDRRGLPQLAVLGSDATLHVLVRAGVDSTAGTASDVLAHRLAMRLHPHAQVTHTKQEGMAWSEPETLSSIGSGSGNGTAVMFRTRVTGGGNDDLVVLSGGQFVTVAHPLTFTNGTGKSSSVVTVDSSSNAVTAAIPARISPDARFGIISIGGTAQPNVALPPVNKTFTVTTTVDGVHSGTTCTGGAACTIRDAVRLADADTAVAGQTKVDTISIPAGTYTFTTAYNPGPDSGGNIGYHYDLDASINIVGVGSATTILNGNALDKIFSADSSIVNPNAPFDIFITGITMENGTNNNPVTATNFFGGIIDWESWGPGNITFNNDVMTGGKALESGGGFLLTSNSNSGFNDVTASEGLVEIDNSTISGNQSPEQGGGILLGQGCPALLNADTFSGNLASPTVNPSDIDGDGSGGGFYTDGSYINGLTTITNSTFTNNTAVDNGGGASVFQGMSMSGTSFTGNKAGAFGGGLFFSGDAYVGTITSSTFTTNSIVGGGPTYGGVYQEDGGGICNQSSTSGAGTDGPQFGNLNMHYSRIHGNTGGHSTGLGIGCIAGADQSATVNATDNWWGCNGAATGTGCDTAFAASPTTQTLTLSPYTTLTLTLSSTTPAAGTTLTATGSLGQDSASTTYTTAQDAAYSTVPATLTIVQGGSTTNSSAASLNTSAAIVTTATTTASGTATVTVDGTSVAKTFTVTAPVLGVTSTHTGNFAAGSTGNTYTLSVANSGNASTSGTITVKDTLPSGFTATAITGTGWSCTLATLTCTNSTVLATSSSLPAITLTVSISSTDAGTYTNGVAVSGGGASANSGTDSTIVVGPPTLIEAFTPNTTILNQNVVLSFQFTNPNPTVALTGVSIVDVLPTGLVISTPTGVVNSCGGTPTLTAGGNSVVLTGASIAAGSNCTLSLDIIGTAAGIYVDNTGAPGSSAGSGVGATATLTVEGSLWVINANGTVAHLSEAGTLITSAGTAGTVGTLGAVTYDNAGDVWAVANGTSVVKEFTSSGVADTVSGNAAAGVNTPSSLAIDGLGQVWVANGNNTVSVLSATGTAVTPTTGYQGGSISTPTGIIIDNSGSVWIPNRGNNSVTKIIGGAAPVVTPTVTGTTNNTLGTRP